MTRGLFVLATFLAFLVSCDGRRAEPTVRESSALAPGTQPIVVDVYTDLICPFCFIGTERLERAIAAGGFQERVMVRYHAFLLQPDMPAEGIDVRSYLRERAGQEASEVFSPVEAMARESGIPLDLSKQTRSYPTIAAHALLRHAEAKGTQRALERALFHAHFLHASNISDVAVLVALATPHGFTEEEVRRIVTDPTEVAAVRRDAEAAARRGVRGVPHFVFNDGRILQGAQSEETLRAALERAAHP
ncbi:MAG: DsbA family oxidoreductase [Labilithrix sp.]|nr:DsbA family oxidoreductase [Labilithrix sp.]